VTNDDPEQSPSWARVDDGTHDRTIEENWLFRLRKERFRSRASGLTHDFFVMHLPDGVHAIAVTPDDQVVLVRQFRAASARDSLEVPGGLVDPGEDAAIAGARELLEETGYAGDPPETIGTLWANPSIATMRTTTIVIRNARKVAEPKLDHTEELAVELAPAGDVMALIQDGRIDHALVVASLLWWRAVDRRPGRS
jgi:8-oxo-dGTP pyrophosphatase MutT (NUDIX family)